MAVNTDNILFVQAHISTDNGNPVLVFIAIAGTDNTGINAIVASFILAYLHSNGKKIFRAATLLLARGKYLLDVHLFAFKYVVPLTGAFDHSYYIKPKFLYIKNLLGIGKPAVKQHIFCLVSCSQCYFQQIYHDISSFLASHKTTLARDSPFANLATCTKDVFFLNCTKF